MFVKKQLNQVKTFHIKTKSFYSDTPQSVIPKNIKISRINLLNEEVGELNEAIIEDAHLEHLAKELADVLYVTYGTIVAYGLQDYFPEIFNAVHESNMSKIASDGTVVLNKEKMKVKKGKEYKKPDIKKILSL